MDSTVIEEKGIIYETFNEEDVSVLIASESSWRGFADGLQHSSTDTGNQTLF